jgi:hypothetical protein
LLILLLFIWSSYFELWETQKDTHWTLQRPRNSRSISHTTAFCISVLAASGSPQQCCAFRRA